MSKPIHGRKTGGPRKRYGWYRVKDQNDKDVYTDPVKFKCEQYIRNNPDNLPGKMRIVPPNT